MYKARVTCCFGLLCLVSSTTLSTPLHAETLTYRNNTHDSVKRHSSVRKRFAENPYEQRRQEIEKQAQLPSPELLKTAPANVAKIAPKELLKKRDPMRITIPNIKAMEGTALPSPDLLTSNGAAPAPSTVKQPKPLLAKDDRPSRTVAAFKPSTYAPGNIAADELAALAPAAGGDDNNTPLIAIPADTPPAAAAPTKPSAAPAPPPPTTTQTASVAEATKEEVSVGEAINDVLKAEEPYEAYNEATQKLPPITPQSTTAKSSEPEQSLSRESKMILKRIPSNIAQDKPKPKGPFNIDRSKDLEEAFAMDEPPASKTSSDEETASVSHEAMGIKIEMKRRTINLDYELEKAYDALVTGQPTLAIEIYKNILSNDPKNKGGLFGLATTYHRLGQLDAARSYYSKLLSIDPKHRDGLNNFLVLLADEAPQEALAQMEELSKRNPNFSPIQAQMAVIYQRLGNTEMATEKMFKAVAMSPENLVYRYNLAIMLDSQKKYDEAERLYKQLVKSAMRGEVIPGNLQKIQQRLTFISSNSH